MKRPISFILTLLIAITAMAETSLIIKPLIGEEQAKALAEIGYVKLTEDSIFVFSHTDYLFSKAAIKDIRHIRYGEQSETPTGDADGSSAISSTIYIYPNPTHDMLIISNANADNAYIFDLNGRLLQTAALQDGNASVNVSSLPNGEYLILLNTQTFKFIKQ